MIGMKIDKVKGLFFDAPKVIAATDRATQRVLSRFGAFVRNAAQKSMLGHAVRRGFGVKSRVSNREGISKPGEPPRPHTGDLVRFIFFAFDRENQSVVIGPTLLNRGSGAPEILEYGGTATMMRRPRGAKNKTQRVPTRVRIEPRPFMGPARDKELPKLPGMWRDSIK